MCNKGKTAYLELERKDTHPDYMLNKTQCTRAALVHWKCLNGYPTQIHIAQNAANFNNRASRNLRYRKTACIATQTAFVALFPSSTLKGGAWEPSYCF